MTLRAPTPIALRSPLPWRSPSRPRSVRCRSDGFLRGSRWSKHSDVSSADLLKRVSVTSKATDSDTNVSSKEHVKKRKVVEHVYLVKAKDDLSEEEEKDMLDYLFTSQYQMRGILAISLGRITDLNADGFTHALFMRFQKKEDLLKFYTNSYYLGVLKDHVIPYCYESMSVDYETEVEDDILPLFRRGEDFNYGVEFVLLISVLENALGDAVDEALTTLSHLIEEFDNLIVQATLGSNLNAKDNGFTHCTVIRFLSRQALDIFTGSSEFKDTWRWKFQPITKKSLALHFVVDPVGTELM